MEKWNHWIGVITNIGVFAGLVMLAIEVKSEL